MNSGCGTNEGVYRILMGDGSDYNFITPGGQIAGISYGDRKFNLVGKCKYYFIQTSSGLKSTDYSYNSKWIHVVRKDF